MTDGQAYARFDPAFLGHRTMADAFDDRTARLSGLRQGLVLGAILVILIWTAWFYLVGRAPTSWIHVDIGSSK